MYADVVALPAEAVEEVGWHCDIVSCAGGTARKGRLSGDEDLWRRLYDGYVYATKTCDSVLPGAVVDDV